MNADRKQAEDFVKNKLNEKTGQGVTLYEHYLANDVTISIGTAVSWMIEYANLPRIEITEEEIMIKDLREKLFGMRFTKYNVRNGCAFTRDEIYGWSQCINELLEWSHNMLSERKEQKTTEEIRLHIKTRKVLKPIEDLYRKEHPHPDGKFYLPDTTEFYKWIVKKIMDK